MSLAITRLASSGNEAQKWFPMKQRFPTSALGVPSGALPQRSRLLSEVNRRILQSPEELLSYEARHLWPHAAANGIGPWDSRCDHIRHPSSINIHHNSKSY